MKLVVNSWREVSPAVALVAEGDLASAKINPLFKGTVGPVKFHGAAGERQTREITPAGDGITRIYWCNTFWGTGNW